MADAVFSNLRYTEGRKNAYRFLGSRRRVHSNLVDESAPEKLGIPESAARTEGTMELAIEGVSKLYKGNVWGLKEFSLTLEPGILGLVGLAMAGRSRRVGD